MQKIEEGDKIWVGEEEGCQKGGQNPKGEMFEMDVISFKELEKLASTPENNRPKNWKSLVIRYLNNKFAFMNEMNKKERDTDYLEKQFVQSVRTARKMGIVWTQK